jgi:hypothetical protein
LDVLCDNPIKYFNQECFLDISPQALNMLVTRTLLNCSKEQVKQIVLKWLQHNQHQIPDDGTFKPETYKLLEKITGIKEDDLNSISFFNIETEIFDQFERCYWKSNETICKINRIDKETIYLHGLGIYTGVEDEMAIEETVTINLSDIDELKNSTKLKTITKTIKNENTVSVSRIMFEKIELKCNHLLCEIEALELRSRFTTKNVCSKNHDHFRNECNLFPHENKDNSTSCIAYLLLSYDHTPRVKRFLQQA